MDRGGKKHLTTQDDKVRITSTQAKQHGGEIKKRMWSAKAQSAADKNEPPQQKWLELANCRAELALILLQTVDLPVMILEVQWHDTCR